MRRILLTLPTSAVLLASCGPTQTSSTSQPARTGQPSGSPRSGETPTGVGTPGQSPSVVGQPPLLSVVAVGASAAADGMLGVAVIMNPAGGVGAAEITVMITAASGNGRPPVVASSAVALLGPGETQGVTAMLHPPADDTIATVSATATAKSVGAAAANPLTVGSPRFTSNAYTASAAVDVSNGGPAASATVVVACFDAGNGVIGGGQLTASIGSGATVHGDVPLAVPATPARCAAWVRPQG